MYMSTEKWTVKYNNYHYYERLKGVHNYHYGSWTLDSNPRE